MVSLDDRAEEHDKPFEELHEEPIDASSPIVVVKEMWLKEHKAGGKDSIMVNDVEHMGKAMVLYQPLALNIQEEQEWADAHEAEVEAFTRLDDPIKMYKNPQQVGHNNGDSIADVWWC